MSPSIVFPIFPCNRQYYPEIIGFPGMIYDKIVNDDQFVENFLVQNVIKIKDYQLL